MLECRVRSATKDGFHSLSRNVMLDGMESFLRSDHQVHVNLLSHEFCCTHRFRYSCLRILVYVYVYLQPPWQSPYDVFEMTDDVDFVLVI